MLKGTVEDVLRHNGTVLHGKLPDRQLPVREVRLSWRVLRLNANAMQRVAQ